MSVPILPTTAEADSSQDHAVVSGSIILSFDVEEHHLIEAAAGLTVSDAARAHYAERVEVMTRWILDRLAEREARATFFVVGQIAQANSRLIRAVADAGHEVASHGWDHQRLHNFTPARFRADLRRSKAALEQATGQPVVGYRAPTFSVVPETRWALDILAEEGFRYDSSIYPVRHDRYGIPYAPRMPFYAEGERRRILEIPPATLRLCGVNLPMGGGGYFRLLPLVFLHWAIRQLRRTCAPPVVMLYFHPWDFDPEQQRLCLTPFSRFRTYVGMNRSRQRFARLLDAYRFTRAADVIDELDWGREAPVFRPAAA
jgi:polysaccharide deacetylase family protein (PEP-CTERM system associated)